jgi:hypothetical protein
LVNLPDPTTTDLEGHGTPTWNPDPSKPPTPEGSVSSYADSATNMDIAHTLDMATSISQFMEEQSATPSFDRVENISESLVPPKAARDVQSILVRFILWITDQKERAAVATEAIRHDDGEAHENPWKPCQPSEDAKEWNGIEGVDGTLPDVGLHHPTTPSVMDGPIVTGEKSRG